MNACGRALSPRARRQWCAHPIDEGPLVDPSPTIATVVVSKQPTDLRTNNTRSFPGWASNLTETAFNLPSAAYHVPRRRSSPKLAVIAEADSTARRSYMATHVLPEPECTLFPSIPSFVLPLTSPGCLLAHPPRRLTPVARTCQSCTSQWGCMGYRLHEERANVGRSLPGRRSNPVDVLCVHPLFRDESRTAVPRFVVVKVFPGLVDSRPCFLRVGPARQQLKASNSLGELGQLEISWYLNHMCRPEKVLPCVPRCAWRWRNKPRPCTTIAMPSCPGSLPPESRPSLV